MGVPSGIDPDRLRRLAADGMTQAEIARAFGVSPSTIIAQRKKHGVSIRGTVGGAPAYSARTVPHWVPASLLDEYREWMKLYGEEAAASHVRKLKAEMLR